MFWGGRGGKGGKVKFGYKLKALEKTVGPFRRTQEAVANLKS